ncbi:DNA replication complex GINS protein PSF2 isoform X2 [Rhineura floridana]|uniref:DNA replication complex GINS protein PSF2 isoform X2 n=1 Tax=Rhineura floridana TaxID=261503 RepID=UPI002AC80B0A|nr:DNA replication complex GINS protein PSF2 isoform X2 [Rhineura floridana]
MDPAEAEFLAERELVTIIPNFSMDRIYLIGGDLGPFNPGLPVEVPLWLAINLKQRQKCRLIPPEWMDVEKLEQIRDQERKEDTFTPMPNPFYMELTKLLLNYAADNIPKADEIRTLVKDTWDTRIAKLRLSADSFVRQQEAHARDPLPQWALTFKCLWERRQNETILNTWLHSAPVGLPAE